ncbi:hypothetical protein LZG51_024445 (plasmid) [Escherichia coli]|nr:hypothetical protein [Escherichia coli]WAX92728.1 hypothetical protein LZG51_024445 [Escherichia coli]
MCAEEGVTQAELIERLIETRSLSPEYDVIGITFLLVFSVSAGLLSV